MNFLNRQLINVNGQLYLVKRILREDAVKNVDAAKELLSCEYAFRKDGFLYFCDSVPEIETINEDEQTQNNA